MTLFCEHCPTTFDEIVYAARLISKTLRKQKHWSANLAVAKSAVSQVCSQPSLQSAKPAVGQVCSRPSRQSAVGADEDAA
jgi:hypothetical protein